MIIDARNLTQNTRQSLPTVNQEQAKELLRLLDKKYTNPNNEEIKVMAPLDSTAEGSRRDTIDLGKTGYCNLKETKLEFACDMEYTKDTALTNAWVNSQNAVFKLFGNSGKVSDQSVTGMSKDEFAEYMKTHELDKEINWQSVNMQVWGSCDFDSFAKFTDHLGALYASLEDRIAADFEGSEQAEQLEKLNAVYDKAVNEVIENIAAKTEQSFNSLGAALPEGRLEKSIRQVVNDKVDAYRRFITQNDDYAEIKKTDDKWMVRDIGFMTNALKNVCKPSNTETGGELWSENDIVALGMVGNMYRYDGLYSKACQMMQHKDEENIGLAISMQWLATEKVTIEMGVSDSVKGLINGLFEKYAKTFIDDVNFALDKFAANPLETTADSFTRLDEKSVYAVLDVMKTTFKESGNAEKAIYAAASYAHDTAMSKLEKDEYNKLWRYNNPKEDGIDAKRFWSSFFNPNSKSKYGNGMGKLMKKWNNFSEILSSKDLYAFKQNTCYNMFRGYASRTLSGPISGGYEKGQYWGTSLENVVKEFR